MNNKKSKFGLGLLIGTIVGGITALFLSPGSGEENREAVKKKINELRKALEVKNIDETIKNIFGEMTAAAKKIYIDAKEEIITRMMARKETWENIDKEEYIDIVNNVIAGITKEFKRDSKQMEKLKGHFLKDWEKIKANK